MKKRITFGRRRRRRNAARSLVRELPNFFKLVFRLLRDPRVPGSSSRTAKEVSKPLRIAPRVVSEDLQAI
jgi:hypothetical protein